MYFFGYFCEYLFMDRLHLIIHGKVQGVYYRANALEQARARQLTGWVRNCANGCVEVVAEGPRELLEQLLAWCRRGPRAARVDRVDADWKPATGEFSGFEILHDAGDDPFGQSGEL